MGKGNVMALGRFIHNSSGRQLVSMLLLCLCLFQAFTGKLAQGQQQQPAPGSVQPSPVPLAHLYWHFLIYQNSHDAIAAQLIAQGKDGTWVRNHLQERMGFSDDDFAPIRISATRLASEVQALNAQAAAIRASGVSPANAAQLKALAAQREADISAEILYLRQSLSEERITAFEAFITQFFAPKNLPIPSASASGANAPSAVQ